MSKQLLKKFNPIIVEEYVDGEEVAICLVGKNTIDVCEAIALTINGNTYFSNQIWGFESKKCGRYTVGRKCITSYVTDQIINSCKKIFLDLKLKITTNNANAPKMIEIGTIYIVGNISNITN